MEFVLLAAALTLSVAIAFAIAAAALECLLAIMTTGSLPFVFHWRQVIFASILFWMWYLTPVVAESRAAVTVIRLLADR